MEINNNESIVKRLPPCKYCFGMKHSVHENCCNTCEGYGYVQTVDSSHFETRFNKVDPIYNTTETCPVCFGEKYFSV